MPSLICTVIKTRKVVFYLVTQSTIKIFKFKVYYLPSTSLNNAPMYNLNHATSAKSKCLQKIKMKTSPNKDVQESWSINGLTLLIATLYKLGYLRMLKWMIKVSKDMEKSFIILPSTRMLEKRCLQVSMQLLEKVKEWRK